MTPHSKEQIFDILQAGQKNANKLPDKGLKEKILNRFNDLEKLVNADVDFGKLEKLARRLSISILDALNFQDMENLQEEEVDIRNEIWKMDS